MQDYIEQFERKADVSPGHSKTLPEEALKIFSRGKEYLASYDYLDAVFSFLNAKNMYVRHLGEMATECGEVYIYFCEALYYFALGITDKAEGDERGTRPSESTDSPPAVLNEDSSETEVKVDTSNFVKETAFSQQDLKCFKSAFSRVAKKIKMEYMRGSAWKYLEKAKQIFERQDSVEAELKVAEILLLFAKINIEFAAFPAAIKELQESLKIYQKHLKSDDSIFADIYYKLGYIYKTENMYPEALQYFQTAKHCFEMYCENFEKTNVNVDPEDINEHDIIVAEIHVNIVATKKLMDCEKEMEGTLTAGSNCCN